MRLGIKPPILLSFLALVLGCLYLYRLAHPKFVPIANFPVGMGSLVAPPRGHDVCEELGRERTPYYAISGHGYMMVYAPESDARRAWNAINSLLTGRGLVICRFYVPN
jgi:hypothetical protein